MQDLKQFFSWMNDINFPYIVLRNWDGLPYSVELGEHSDLDLLVYDFEHWKELYPEAKQVYPDPRVQFKVPIGDSFIQVDVRHVGDGYYPTRFEKLLLDTRERHPEGFFIPAFPLFRIALAYHCVHHKNENTYPRWLGEIKIEELLAALKESDIGWSEPKDTSVGRFNSYLKGATSTIEKQGDKVTKTQTNYLDYDLIKNEWRILSQISSLHFPQVYNAGADDIEIENCGETLTVENLPPGWKEQLVTIIKDLKIWKVEHRDIRPDNLMVKDGVIKLIDFGWARFKNDPPDNPPSCLGYPYRPSYGWDDNFSMAKIIREFEFKKEEALCIQKS
jgi:hypothetical protein